MNYKVCKKCNKILLATNEFFFKHKHGKYGLESQCKECVKKRRQNRHKNIIYEIYCDMTDTYYIGQTIKSITERISKHFSDAKCGRKQPLYIDMRKYGKEHFTYRILEETNNENNLDNLERYYIKKYIDENKKIYNREFGGRKNIQVSEETSIEMAKSKGTKPFMVFDSDGIFLGEYNTITNANNELGYLKYMDLMDNTQLNFKNYIVISKEKFSIELLCNEVKAYEYLEDFKDELYPTKSRSGKNNPMYGKKGKLNNQSKAVICIKDDIIEKFNCTQEAEEKYNFQVKAYARGVSNHYYKKLNMYVYYEDDFLRL